jgi:callose synthase
MEAGPSSSAAMSVARRRRDALAQTLASRRLPEGMAEAGERVPGAVAPEVMPFLRAADEIEPYNPRVAFLCE